jgi:hypothetical protein
VLAAAVFPKQDKEAQDREGAEVAAAMASNGAASSSRNGAASGNGANGGVPSWAHNPLSPYRVRLDLPDLLSKEIRDLN